MNKQQLVITTLDGTPFTEDWRWYNPASWEPGTEGFVILVEPVTPDVIGGTDESVYGSVRVITDDGGMIVSTVSLGLLVLPVGE